MSFQQSQEEVFAFLKDDRQQINGRDDQRGRGGRVM